MTHPDLQSLTPLLFASTPEEERFFNKVRQDKNGCWVWRGAKSPAGYGRVSYEGRPHQAHRVSFLWFYGPEALGDFHVHHRCRNTSCVNPLHLQAVTQAENNRFAHLGRPKQKKTHCKHGHLLSGPNAGVRGDGKGVYCRACNRASCARYWRRRKQAQ